MAGPEFTASLLAVETSTEACSVAVSVDGRTWERFEHAPTRHAELLLPAIRRVLAEADVSLAQLDAIAFGRGPGSFTSLRIGIGAVQGLAWGAGLGVVPVSSLAALAQQALERASGRAERVLAAVDARMGEVFSAVFEPGPGGWASRLGEERLCAPQAVSVPERPYVAAGNAFSRFDELGEAGRGAALCLDDIWPRAGQVAALAGAWLEHHAALPASQAQPVYLRDRVAAKPIRDEGGLS